MRVVLVCTCADHPAMCKAGGFADKSHHNTPCTQGLISTDEMYSDECLSGGTSHSYGLPLSGTSNKEDSIGCPARSAQEHVQRAREWRDTEDRKERDALFKLHGSRWSELMRLPYYDCVKMTVIDPMHNLLLGVSL